MRRRPGTRAANCREIPSSSVVRRMRTLGSISVTSQSLNSASGGWRKSMTISVSLRAGLFLETPASGDADVFDERDLDVIHVLAVPDRLEDGVREAEHQHVLHGFLSEGV